MEIGQGTLLAGRYRLEHPLDTDLDGVEAWSGRDQILDRTVRALLLREGRATQAQDAARRAALVSDPRLLRVLDVGQHEGLPYAVTEPLEGKDLAELTANGPLPADQARAVVGEAAVALEVARRRGVHHLALRPSAVRVTGDGRVVVAGLGIDGEILGHHLGDALSTTRADTVALVSLLYLALTGRWPAPAGMSQGHVPEAPHVEGFPLPPAELAPGVPNDLDTLCAVTLGANDDGPHSPAELVRELEPWAEVRGHPEQVDATAPSAPAGLGPGMTGPVNRTSVRRSLGEPAAPPRPGTPPPAIPPRGRPAVAAAAGTGAAATSATVTPGGPPSVPPVLPAPSGPSQPAEPAGPPGTTSTQRPWAPTGGDRGPATSAPSAPRRPAEERTTVTSPSSSSGGLARVRFDPTPWVLGFVVIGVVIGIAMAWQALTAPLPPIGPSDEGVPDVVASPTEEPSAEEETPEATPSATPEPTGPPPAIASGVQLDPEGDGDEHPEAVERAFDGDTGTYWFTRTYANPRYGMKSGVGYAVTLEEETVVSSVALDINGSGGEVEIRATDPSTPTEGEVLASGDMGRDRVYELSEPVTTQTIVLWFTELPVTPEGKNRVELLEMSLS